MLVDRTVSKDFLMKTICASVTSLSPFAVAESLSPTAASVAVSGRVLTAGGRGIFQARVSITNPNGDTQTAITNPFGYYRFAEIPSGETYFVSVRHKQYHFSPQVLTVLEEIQDVNFTAEP